MRRITSLLAPLALIAAPLAAQQAFEGNVTLKLGEPAMTFNMTMKGSKILMKVPVPATLAAFTSEAKVIIDNQTKMTTILIDLGGAPPQLQQMLGPGIKMVAPAEKAAPGAAPTPPKKLATSQTIAGLPCDDYEMNDSVKTRACLTKALGSFTFPSLSMGGAGTGGARGGAAGGAAGGLAAMAAKAPAWVSALGGSGWFPLKAWTPDGKVQMEVTTVERAQISDDVFAIPADYRDGSAMMNGMGGMGRGGRGGGGR